jgi:hypothetical protein
MTVSKTIYSHPKFLALVRAVGKCAMFHLTKLWSYCEIDQRGANFGKVDAVFIEEICEWDGETGKLFEALTRKVGGSGWLELRKNGVVVVHDWESNNRRLIKAWAGGASTRK